VSSDDLVRDLADRLAIQDCLVRYSRGIDRLDEDLIRSAYWEDSTDDHGNYRGNGHEFAAFAVPRLRRAFETTHHVLSNSTVDLDGDRAHVETYVQALHVHHPDEQGHRRTFLFGGRYVDRMERRGAEWRIADRVVVRDWSRVDVVTDDIEDAWRDSFVAGRRDRTDRSYER
jgi:hypothetical protein